MTTSPPTMFVMGATGKIGRRLVPLLLDRGAQVRALVRDPDRAGLPTGVELRAGEVGDPASVIAAADGVDSVFVLWPSMSAEGAEPVIDGLARAGRHLAVISSARLQGDEEGSTPGVWSDVEDLVTAASERTGSTWTFLRGGGFAGNTLEWAEQVRGGGPVRIFAPEAVRSLVHEGDLAEVAAATMLDPDTHAGRAYVLTGPDGLAQREQLATIGRVLGRDLALDEQSFDEAYAERRGPWGEEAAERSLRYWESLVERPERVTDDVPRLLGRPALSYEQWVRDHVADFT